MKHELACCAVLAITGSAIAETWTVDDDGPADFDNIQAAVDAASDGDVVIVEPGTYTSTQSGHVVSMLGKRITLQSTDPNDPDVVASTIIDGEDTRRGIACFNQWTNSYTKIKGFTITNGKATFFEYGDDHPSYFYAGGGIIVVSDSRVEIINCVIDNCRGEHAYDGSGGGMAIIDASSEPGVIVHGCTFTNNIAPSSSSGGAMFIHTSMAKLSDCVFVNNSGAVGGAIDFSANCYDGLRMTNCIVDGNTAGLRAGGIDISLTCCPNQPDIPYNYAIITGCQITNNILTQDTGGWNWNCGGGIYTSSSWCTDGLTITDTIVCGNSYGSGVEASQICSSSGGWIDGGGNAIFEECQFGDADGDGVIDMLDNCVLYNPDQADCNGNGIGDICDIADGTSVDVDGNSIPDECEPDCNENTIPDHWDIATGMSDDCNGNQVPDECDIADGTSIDCNDNLVPDECDIADGSSDDCNDNGTPDDCEPDCNGNGVQDDCDIADGTSSDIDGNGIPDDCQDDCNGNGIPDYWDIKIGISEDCNENDVPDECDIAGGSSDDCNLNDVPDECDIADGTSNDIDGNAIPDECEPDCNDNDIPDHWDIHTGSSEDCNMNEVPDECDIADGTSNDIDQNGVPDECKPDCNGNGIPDSYDIGQGTSYDCDQNGVPDECQVDCDGDGLIDPCDNDPDIDGDGIPDNCEEDCNGNSVPDDYEIEIGLAEDCNVNLVPDECDISDGSAEDCNSSGIPDSCELADGTVDDLNENEIIDDCECLADISDGTTPGTPDGLVNVNDLLAIIGYWGSDVPIGDINFDGTVGVDDLLIVIGAWGPCP